MLRTEAIARLRATMAHDDLSITDQMAEIRAMHCASPRDAKISRMIDGLKRSLATVDDNDKGNRILFVCGESNSGKTELVRHALASDPYFTEAGADANMLWLKAPSPSTLRNFAVRGLKTMGFSVRPDIRETHAWPELEEQLAQRSILFLVVDEAQRTMKINDAAELQKLSDSLVSLVDSSTWPIRLILIGVQPLEDLRTRDEQVFNRSNILTLGPVSEKSGQRVSDWITSIIDDHARLDSSELPKSQLSKQLIHACDGNAGSMITLTRNAVECMLRNRKGKQVLVTDFAQAYHDLTYCAEAENIFENETWADLPSGLARIQSPDDDGHETEIGKPMKSGNRPR
ncbi:ATP-binding protein [Endobacterium cereale]|uniref:ATP-binding protein n=1 Tax=Endobacterium cereale TaxID=2663029 RepID=UPI002B49208B|nr:ATP-binding protein [Endobacterium cereale]MEB2845981.1 ATP-binding protein [Endobacterium cereale]